MPAQGVEILTNVQPRPAAGPRSARVDTPTWLLSLRESRMTSRYITKYEKARVLGTRALQIRYEISDAYTDSKVGVAV